MVGITRTSTPRISPLTMWLAMQKSESTPDFGHSYAKMWYIWGGWSCVMLLSWLNTNVIVLVDPFLTYTKCLLQHQGVLVGLTWPSIPGNTPLARVPVKLQVWSIWGGYSCVMLLPWLKANITVSKHLFGTYAKCVAAPGRNGWAHITLNAIHIPLSLSAGYTKMWSILGGSSCMVPLPWLKPTVIILEHPSGTYTKCVATPGSNNYAHMILNTMQHPLAMGLALQKSDITGGRWSCVVLSPWFNANVMVLEHLFRIYTKCVIPPPGRWRTNAMNVLSPIPHVLWVHGQGLTSLRHDL